jgi:xylan 1,4-beta-xylosidase
MKLGHITTAVLALGVAAFATPALAQQRTYANPIDIDYRYNFEQLNEGISYRTGADPVIVLHKGAYYLFQTLADGYWRSENLIDWTFIKPSRWPFNSIVAPAVVSDGERLIIMPSSMHPQALLATDAPETGRLEFLTRLTPPLPNAVQPFQEDDITGKQLPPGPWDPALFRDDDGQWYLYWNSSNVFPLYAMHISMDPFAYQGEATRLFRLDPDKHGWERFGRDHSGTWSDGRPIAPFMEGAWMNKVGGRYYLQYGAPGTEYNVYANGVYVSDAPLGPFTYADYNPVAYKPGGFVNGAGHGSTFQDVYGNYWNTGTPWIGVNWNFERRIAMFPAKFESDGQMQVSARFGDFPHFVPTSRVDNPEDLFTGWMLLSYRARATASSTLRPARGETLDPSAANVTDENPRTYWVAANNAPGQTLTIDLGARKQVRAVQVNFTDYKAGRFGDAPEIYTEFQLEHSLDGRRWRPLARTEPPRRDRPNAYFELPQPVETRYIRYVHEHIGGAHLAISDVRVFGTIPGPAPATPQGVTAVRDADARNAHVAWRPVRGAVGYNVRWGVRPDRLNLAYQLFADQGAALELRALNVGVGYYVAVESFDERGVSEISPPIHLP